MGKSYAVSQPLTTEYKRIRLRGPPSVKSLLVPSVEGESSALVVEDTVAHLMAFPAVA